MLNFVVNRLPSIPPHMNERHYDNNLRIKDALQLYFSKYHFTNGGYDLKWFRIKLGPVYLPFPNTKGRIAAVKLHDIHHVITEYLATLKGEAEIGAWELASGCGKYYIAWVLNAASFFYGVFFFPVAIYHAFMNGRSRKTNFYKDTVYDETLLNKTVGELRDITAPVHRGKNIAADHVVFFLSSITVYATTFISIYLLFLLFVLIF